MATQPNGILDIQVGKHYITRTGRSAHVLEHNVVSMYPYWGLIDGELGETWLAGGFSQFSGEGDNDLVRAEREEATELDALDYFRSKLW